jgi:hypothetical protein
MRRCRRPSRHRHDEAGGKRLPTPVSVPCNLNLTAFWTLWLQARLLASDTTLQSPNRMLPKRWRTFGAWGSSREVLNVAALLEEDKVTLMLAQHHIGEARRLFAERARSRGRDASEVGQRLRSVEAFLAVVQQHLDLLLRPPVPPSVR